MRTRDERRLAARRRLRPGELDEQPVQPSLHRAGGPQGPAAIRDAGLVPADGLSRRRLAAVEAGSFLRPSSSLCRSQGVFARSTPWGKAGRRRWRACACCGPSVSATVRNGPSAPTGGGRQQYYREESRPLGGNVLSGGDVYGIPQSRPDDFGLLTDLLVPWSERFRSTWAGGSTIAATALDPLQTRSSPSTTARPTTRRITYYTPGFADPHVLLGMGYLTDQVKLREQTTVNAGRRIRHAHARPGRLYSDDPFVPIARFGNSYVSGWSHHCRRRRTCSSTWVHDEGEDVLLTARGASSP